MRYALLATLFLATACGTADKLKSTDTQKPGTDKPADSGQPAAPQDKPAEAKAAAPVAAVEATEPTRGVVAVYAQETDQYIGTAIGTDGTVRLDDGSILQLDSVGAPHWVLASRNDHVMTPTSCAFISDNCSGECFATDLAEVISSESTKEHPQTTHDAIGHLMKNALYYTDSGWYRATGTESQQTHISLNSYIAPGGTCTQKTWIAGRAFLMSNTYDFSLSPKLPFTAFGEMYYK